MRVLVVAAAVLSLLTPSLALAAPADAPPPPPMISGVPAEKPEKPKAPLPPATPERLALAKRIMDADGGVAGFNALVDGVTDGLISGLKPSNDVLTLFGPYKTRALTSLHLHMPAIVNAMASAWARVYTEDELKAQVAYFESPTTQSLVAKLPRIVNQVGAEIGWVARQFMLTDPDMRKYLADVTPGVTAEPPLAWATPPAANLAAIRERIAKTPGGKEFLEHPDKFMDKAASGRGGKTTGKNPIPSKIEKRIATLLPQVVNDLIAIVANNVTPEELEAQEAYSKSPAGLIMSLKMKDFTDTLEDDFRVIFKEIGKDTLKPAQSVALPRPRDVAVG
jgi:hypothetical protein